ncbi:MULTISPECIES: hypothetical protein [Leptospira]|uniref:Uncharacterized protein n=4 Tax=Leptospira weilii TaxID=28184 RepID=A0A828Z2T8_9LEPT|nr:MULTISPECIES: hypothetical protein [Leptospira]EMM70641.1 hypothetical protein LEP1GSC038_1109 [Leptospira weilii str. 2006001855]EKR64019.1 hypothetical protein LEP1GSC036_1275 [Leptospira weilii str. 2006001853]EMJ59661.1 hypothetical protein LEP1GSC051_3845 [Leptospira sp. P2653]EMN43124.1 hypothetical protein LEP1GSC086_0361 [Leptospira weilii str. LNT 1234]EMN89640.1 hypothetical protein LEP1GSC108_2555 [Leptospira weilii str. UI 13098]
MKPFLRILVCLLFLFVGQMTFSQNAEKPDPNKKDGGTEYYPLAYYDERLAVKNISFFRRHSDNGKGEFLDVMVEMENRNFDAAKFSIYILAVNETTAVSAEKRDLVPFPKWRGYDAENSTLVINFQNLMPQKLDSKSVWGEEKYNKAKKDYDDRIARGEIVKMSLPALTEIITYLTNHSENALEFTIYGEQGPKKDQVLISNFVDQTEEEKKKQAHESLNKHTYTIYNAKYKTTLMSHHYTEYRPGYLTYNKIVILIFNPLKEKNKLVYRKFIDVGKVKLLN